MIAAGSTKAVIEIFGEKLACVNRYNKSLIDAAMKLQPAHASE